MKMYVIAFSGSKWDVKASNLPTALYRAGKAIKKLYPKIDGRTIYSRSIIIESITPIKPQPKQTIDALTIIDGKKE